jgi:dihydropteroate synthase
MGRPIDNYELIIDNWQFKIMFEDIETRTIATAHGPLEFGPRCLVMGILNVTPDSFSDGGRFMDPSVASDRAIQLAAEGADIIDIGGESTRPGALPVEADEQIRRIVPAVREMRRRGVKLPVSVDTRSAKVAAEALEAGADMVNDVSGASDDPQMPGLLRTTGVPFVIMHMKGAPLTMQDAPRYDDVAREVGGYFERRAAELDAAGVDTGVMIVDPGIGFGKTLEHNLEILRRIGELRGRWPVLVGASRKRFLGTLMGGAEAGERMAGSLAVAAHCALAGVEMVRVHDVRETRRVVAVCAAIKRQTPPSR